MNQHCRHNGHVIECIQRAGNGWMGVGLNLETGQHFIQLFQKPDGTYGSYFEAPPAYEK